MDRQAVRERGGSDMSVTGIIAESKDETFTCTDGAPSWVGASAVNLIGLSFVQREQWVFCFAKGVS